VTAPFTDWCPNDVPTKKLPMKGKTRRSKSMAEKSSIRTVVEPFFNPAAESNGSDTKAGKSL